MSISINREDDARRNANAYGGRTRVERATASIDGVTRLASAAMGAVGAAIGAVRFLRGRAGRCCVKFDCHRDVEAVLYYLTYEKPSIRWANVRMTDRSTYVKGGKKIVVPLGPVPIRVPGEGVSVRVIGITKAIGDHGTTEAMTMEVHTRSVEVAKAFVERAVAHFNKSNAAQMTMRHYVLLDDDFEFSDRDMPEQTFDTVYVPRADEIRRLGHEFEASGEMSKRLGLRHKLNLLLHGEPGCGKTSMGPAIANSLGRSLFTVPLSKIRTIAELQKLLRCMDVSYESLANAVVVFEDCDTWAPLTQRRKLSRPQSSSDGTDVEDDEGSSRSRQTRSPSVPESVEAAERRERIARENDLGVLLNELDGADVAYGRILVFTTNRIDCFDDALLRPGRMNLVEFGRLDAECVERYHRLYFDAELPDEARRGVEARPPTLAELSELLATNDAGAVAAGLAGRSSDR